MSEAQSLIERYRNFLVDSGIYHALYKASEYIGGETWGNNTAAYTEFVKKIPEEVRKNRPLRMLLLGSATTTSIKQALDALQSWKSQGIISDGKLTVIDISIKGLGKDKELRDKINFVQADIRELPFVEGQFDFITSDYILNFIPQEQISKTIDGLSTLLSGGGVLSISVETKKSGKGLTQDDLNKVLPERCDLIEPMTATSKGVAKISQLLSDRIVWGFQKQ